MNPQKLEFFLVQTLKGFNKVFSAKSYVKTLKGFVRVFSAKSLGKVKTNFKAVCRRINEDSKIVIFRLGQS
ncbi:hypothetical protein M0802_015935 [Mischocyttarus mexicanus]|nr:hypothetical protein M0802_015935 [Mischocyttarus mexicanus]